MEPNKAQEMRVAVKCKNCMRKIFYKSTPLTGVIELKCPRCQQVVSINLAYRRSHTPISYRKCAPMSPNFHLSSNTVS